MKYKSNRIKGKTRPPVGRLVIPCFCLFVFCFLLSPLPATAQRDYLTDEEIELVRDAQQIDERIDVLVQAIDRRFGAIQINVGLAGKRPSGEWGELPKGTRAEMLFDIRRILQKAIDDIDNLSERPDSMVVNPEEKKKPKGFAELFPKAVRKLDAAARRYQPALKSALDTTKDAAEQGSIIASLEMCDQITAAVTKLPAEVKKGKN
jgi:hypothetical protein